MSFKYKIGRNDPCLCGSGKKFKKCCIDYVEQMEQEHKQRELESFINGHEFVNEQLEYIRDWVIEQYPDFKVIDVSNIVTHLNYRALQTEHYYSKHGNTVLLAFRNEQNKRVFEKRSPRYTNVIFMYKGAYQVFNDFSFGNMTVQLKKMIDLRLENKDYEDDAPEENM